MANTSISRVIQAVGKAIEGSPEALVKWQAIQDNLGTMPPDALRDLIVDIVRVLMPLRGPIDADAFVGVIDTWYHKALSAASHARDPVTPVLTEEQWLALPDRWFEGPPKLKTVS